MNLKNTILTASLSLIMSALTAHTAHAHAVLKRSILTLLALTTLAIAVKAEPNGQSNFVPWAPKHENGVKALEAEIVALQKEIAQIQSTNAALQRQVNLIASNPSLQIGPFVSVDPNPENGVTGPNIVFTGANLHIVNGALGTGKVNGLGNLIIGYDEATTLNPGDRSGSHTLVMGEYNTFTSHAFGGVVFGTNNRLDSFFTSILGGTNNLGQSTSSVIVGGDSNAVLEDAGNVVVGGDHNACYGFFDVALGGEGNGVDGGASVIVSGHQNTILMNSHCILGGDNINVADGRVSLGPVVSGPITIITPTPTPVP